MKKKKGSSLVLVLLLASAIMMVTTVCITAVSMNVKMRVEENKRIQSLYGAEAGLEYANNLIIKTYDSATQYAEKQVQKEIQQKYGLTKLETLSNNMDSEFEKEMNQIFKKEFIKFINSDSNFDIYPDTNEFIQSINKSHYISLDDSYKKTIVNVQKNTGEATPPLLTAKSKIQAVYREGELLTTDNTKYAFDIESEFQSVENGINNQRKLQVSYEIEIPDYRGEYSSQTIDIFKVFNDKIMTVDGNLIFENASSNITVDGKVFVVGEEETGDNLPYDKYRGGISVDGAQVTFKDEVMTAKTLNAYNGSQVKLVENLYARNLYIGDISGNLSTAKLTLDKAAILDNDLALKAKNSVVTIYDFYGLNDKTFYGQLINDKDKTNGNDTENQNQTVERVSSSIIVNGNENSLLHIKHSAYILGVAYINTTLTPYQTGESVAIKGNYIAYSHPLPESKEYSNVEFGYYTPLQLVDSLNGQPLSVLQKSEYFKEFYESNTLTPDTGNVTLPMDNLYTAGAVVYKTGNDIVVEKSRYDQTANDHITNMRKDYAEKVYAMGTTTEDKLNLYNSLGIGTGNQDKVKDLIDFGKAITNCQVQNVSCQTKNMILASKEGIQAPVVVMGANVNESNYTDTTENKYFKFNPTTLATPQDSLTQIEGLIIVDGDVIIDGAIDFKGNIIATGTVTVTGGGKQTFTYDSQTTNRIIASNYTALKDVFKGDKLSTHIVNQFEEHESIQYSPADFIDTKNWKIIK